MDLRQDVLRLLPFLPNPFSDDDLDRWEPWLRRRHRELINPRRAVLMVLDQLGQEGRLRAVGREQWLQPDEPVADGGTLDLPLQQGDETDREELARIIGTDGPAPLQRGIFKRADGPFRDQLLLFHDPQENPYGDVVKQDVIQYVGQGRQGDQKLQGFNRYIAEHLKRGLTVHFFEKEDASGRLLYRGEVVCDDVERVYRPNERRSVLQFTLVPIEPLFHQEATTPVGYYRKAREEISTFTGEPRLVERARQTTVATRLVRDKAFRDILLEAYEKRCAVCGVPLMLDDLTELEAAHIVGVAEQGPDDPRNGLSLCVRHHWAFDHGVFTLTDDHRVRLFLEGEDPHGELVEEAQIHVPGEERLRPHGRYLAYHREKWGAVTGESGRTG